MPGDVGARPGSKPKRAISKQANRLARARVKHPDATLKELAAETGYKGADTVCRALNSDAVKARIRELLEASPKLRVAALTKRLAEGLAATETKFFQHEGEVTDEREVVDYGTRHRYLETALELHGAREKPTADGTTVNNFFTKEAIEAFVAAFKRKPPLSNGHDT